MAKKILAAANNKEQKYFMEEEFKFLPDTIKEDLKRICVYMAEKLNCTFLVGFDDNGDVYFETIKHSGIRSCDCFTIYQKILCLNHGQ